MQTNVEITGISPEEFFKKISEFADSGIEEKLAKMSAEWFRSGFPESRSDNGGRKTDKSINGWPKRKKEYLYPALNKTGNLKKSVVSVQNSVKTDVYYASFHNDGTDRLPQRQFIGNSKELDKKCEDMIVDELTKYLNKL